MDTVKFPSVSQPETRAPPLTRVMRAVPVPVLGAGRWGRGSHRERRREAYSTGARALWSDAGYALGAEYQPSRAALVSPYQ